MDDGHTPMDTSGEHNMPDKLISTSISSCNELTSSSKRVLVDTSVDLADLKKIKLFDNNDEKQINESHVNLIIKETPDHISETTENDNEEHSNISNEMRTDSNSDKNNSIYDKDSNICNTVHNVGVDNLKTNSEENIDQDEFIDEEDSSDSNSSFKSFDLEFTKNINHEFVQNNSNIYENKSLTDNLVTVEKSNHVKEDINENSMFTEISSNDENAKNLEEIVNIENKKTDDIYLTEFSTHQNDNQSGTESADDITIIKCDDKNDTRQNDNQSEIESADDIKIIKCDDKNDTHQNDNQSGTESADDIKIIKCDDKNDTHQNDNQSGTESADDIKIIKCDDKNDKDHNDDTVVNKIDHDYINNENDVGTTEKDNASDIEDNVKVDDILKCCNELTKANFPILIKILSKKNVEFEHFENTCLKIISLYMSNKIKEKIEVKMNEISDIQKCWHNKYISLSQQVKDHIDYIKLLKDKLKIDSNDKPHQIIRSVGIQVDMFKADQKQRSGVSKVVKPSQKPQNTFINNIVNLDNDSGSVNETTDANYTYNNDVNYDFIAINDVGDDCTINNNNVKHGISNNSVKHVVVNNPIVISDDDDDNENSVTLKTQSSTLMNTMKTKTSIQQLRKSNTNEESSEFLTTTILNFQNLPEISLSSINRSSDIIDLTEDDDYDESNNENRAVLQSRTTIIDRSLCTQTVIPSGQPFLYTQNLLTAQLRPNNSDQHQQQSSGALQNVPTKFIRFITPTNGTKKFIHIRTPQQFLELSAPPDSPRQFLELSAPPNSPQQFLERSAAPPSGPLQRVKPNARQTGSSRRSSNVIRLCQPSTSAAIVQLPPSSQIKRTLRSSCRPVMNKHPAPLPKTKNRRSHGSWKKLPSAPIMHVPCRVVPDGFVVKWDLITLSNTAEIRSYQFYIYDEARSPPKPTSETWMEIGEVRALPLPMACSFSLVSMKDKHYGEWVLYLFLVFYFYTVETVY